MNDTYHLRVELLRLYGITAAKRLPTSAYGVPLVDWEFWGDLLWVESTGPTEI